MDHRIQFEEERQAYSGTTDHIAQENDDPGMREIDAMYGAADALSLQNAKKHRRVLWELSAVGTLLTMFFLLYDEAELYGLILACGVMILSLFLIRTVADRSECHRKYLEYRVLAESARVQYFLFLAGADVRVTELMPWSITQGIPWVCALLTDLPFVRAREKQSVFDCWIRNQKTYHESKLQQMLRKNIRDNRIAKVSLIVTITAYFAALVFEILVARGLLGGMDVNLFRAIIKIVVGTMSAFTLFTGNYYGKMSLPNIIDDHSRMAALYKRAEERIAAEGESRELLLFLARECLNENAAWYAYQNKNKPDLVI